MRIYVSTKLNPIFAAKLTECGGLFLQHSSHEGIGSRNSVLLHELRHGVVKSRLCYMAAVLLYIVLVTQT
jgi:hypothetical protein